MNSTRLPVAGVVALALAAALAAAAEPPARYVTGSDQTYVHRINLVDAEGNLIGPDSTAPYSPNRTCAKCHDVERIAMGRHFQAGFDGVHDGRPGEPWILWDQATGTQLPLSHRDWALGKKRRPADLGLTDWEFAFTFGRQHPGGGMLEWQKDGRRRDAFEEAFLHGGPALGEGIPAPLWKQVGSLEVDCLACHLNGGYSNGNRWYYLHTELNFRAAPTAAAGLGTVRVNTKDQLRLRKADLADTPNWAPYLAKDSGIQYDPARFDPDGRVALDLTRRPPARNCQVCHATRMPGVTDKADPAHDLDVHTAAGMACTDCHRNGIDHEILRGDGGGEGRHTHPGSETLTCRGCHESGRLGAPGIEHYGMPAFHLDKLACTVCHSGPKPASEVGLILTARAHALGLKTFLNLDAKMRPAVQAPIYRKDEDGVIRPHYGIWPAWYGIRKGAEIDPLPLQRVKEVLGEVVPVVQAAEMQRTAEEVRKNGEEAWKAAEGKKGRTPPKEEVEVAGRNAVIVWQENLSKDMARAEEEAFWSAEQALRKRAAAKGARITEEDLRNAMDQSRAAVRIREDEKTRAKHVTEILKAFSAKEKGDVVYVAGGKAFQADGKVVDNAPQAVPYLWPIGHAVRGAGEALGSKGCSDCHAVRSPFFFGTVKAQPAGPGGDAMELKQCTLMGFSKNAIRIGAVAVMARENAMKRIGFLVVLGLIGFACFHMLIVGLRGPAVVVEGKPKLSLRWSDFSITGFTGFALCAILCATGAGFLATYGPSPIFEIFTAHGTVKLHFFSGLVFTFMAAALAARWLLLVLRRDPSLKGTAGGLLWPVKAEDESPLLSWIRCGGCWVLLDILCCVALAVTGFIMAGRLPLVGDKLHILERLAEHRFIGPFSYAIHGAAGSLMIVRLLGHLYARFVLRKR
jgi:hypothetical protein